MTFGKFSHSTQPGFNWRWPYPIQTHEVVNLSQVRTVEIGYRSNVRNKLARESLMLTDDENIIDIDFAVFWRIRDVTKYLFNFRAREEVIKAVAESTMRRWSALSDPAPSRNSAASQSRSSGWLGGEPIRPKSLGVSTIPRPK